MTKTQKYLLIGGGALIVIYLLFFRSSSLKLSSTSSTTTSGSGYITAGSKLIDSISNAWSSIWGSKSDE